MECLSAQTKARENHPHAAVWASARGLTCLLSLAALGCDRGARPVPTVQNAALTALQPRVAVEWCVHNGYRMVGNTLCVCPTSTITNCVVTLGSRVRFESASITCPGGDVALQYLRVHETCLRETSMSSIGECVSRSGMFSSVDYNVQNNLIAVNDLLDRYTIRCSEGNQEGNLPTSRTTQGVGADSSRP